MLSIKAQFVVSMIPLEFKDSWSVSTNEINYIDKFVSPKYLIFRKYNLLRIFVLYWATVNFEIEEMRFLIQCDSIRDEDLIPKHRLQIASHFAKLRTWNWNTSSRWSPLFGLHSDNDTTTKGIGCNWPCSKTSTYYLSRVCETFLLRKYFLNL